MIIIYLLLTLSTPIFAGIFHSNSSCGLNEFTCTSGECISYNDVCNIIPDCSDGSDEDLCQGYSDSELQYIRSKRQLQIRCRANQWQCRDKTCISFDGVCDGVIDCRDNSDETFALCRNNTCQSNWFRCTYGACVDGTAPCNDVQDCADNSDELLPRCRNDTNGALGTFFCESGQQVISTTDVCDGVKNCNDGSDETLRVCADKTCPSYLFQCAYGACVDQGSDCNNVEDCADGSDESLELCRPDQIFAITSTPAAVPIQPHFCVLPPYPLHGTYSVGGETKARPGDAFQFAVLNYTCSLGYGLENELGIIYCQDGTWYGEFPKCVQLCRLNKHPSVEYRCLISGPRGEEGSRECNLYEPLGTVARPDCKKPNYYSNGVLSFMRCQEGGWDNYPVCTPECGRLTPEGTGLIVDGRPAQRGELPWHAGIYRTTTRPYMQICGGSIINTKAVVSAAHCFWSDSEKKLPVTRFAVAVGKIYRPWNNPNDTDAQKFEVSEIRIPSRFQGSATNFQDDLAIVVLKTPIIYHTFIRPVCLDFGANFDRRQLQLGKFGKVAGWGLTGANGQPSPILLVLEMPYVDINVCYEESPPGFREFITSDKICAGYRNGSALCKGDSGGGLAFPDTDKGIERYYLRGIVSTAPRNEDKCNLYWRVLLPDITAWYQPHAKWIARISESNCALLQLPATCFCLFKKPIKQKYPATEKKDVT